tara:strand:+ start:4488 stop:4676 length:189 start_codon:yes stop_codon:yes gene_type:complete
MSDINDLIATNAHQAYEVGILAERRRVIKLLEQLAPEFQNSGYSTRIVKTAIKRINAEQEPK